MGVHRPGVDPLGQAGGRGRTAAWQVQGSWAASAAILALPLNLVSLVVPNAAALLLPAWFATPTTPGASRGIEVIGQRFIFLLGQFVVLLAAALPVAVTLFLGYVLLAEPLLGQPWALPVASGLAAVVCATEAAGGLLLLGRWFEGYDLSAEKRRETAPAFFAEINGIKGDLVASSSQPPPAPKPERTVRSPTSPQTMPYQPIENYGVIGNLQTVALVGMNASIDFLSFPYFDSPTVFAALLDEHKGGYFQLTPLIDGAKQKQLYLLDTNILLSRFLAPEGVAEISDFMPVSMRKEGDAEDNVPTQLVRRAKTVRGELSYRMVCAPRFDYARKTHRVVQRSEHELVFIAEGDGGMVMRLRSMDVPMRVENGDAVAEFTLRADEKAAFVLEEVRDHEVSPCEAEHFVAKSFKETMNFWREWTSRSTYKGRWREMVNRSALVLKMLTSQKYGSIVAAPTFGLPEQIGGGRNWDYRYTWIRDASFTLYGLNRLGYNDEAAAFMKWIEARVREMEPDGSLQLMYGIDGHHNLTEQTLDHFEGYRKSTPVRIGNGAYDQLQLDIYGELMDSVYLFNKYGRPIDYDAWQDITRLVDWVCKNYRQKDEGIWEVRGGAQEFLYSRLMCWVAVDRGIRLAEKRSFPTPPIEWFKTRNDIYNQIYTDFWDPKQGAFIQAIGRKDLDAASLMMPMVRFLSPTDRRWLSTLRGIERELVEDSLVYRYRTDDGLSGGEGTFCMCSFWYVECLARSGDLEQARYVFEKMLGYANHVGLYAEELGPSGEHLGNFPQAFTHLGLISAAYNLDRLLDNPRALV